MTVAQKLIGLSRGFDPLSISGAILWHKTDSLSQSDNTDITTISDSSGNGKDGTGVGATKPKFRTNVVNGKPAMQFDGATSYVLASGLDSANLKPSSIFFVVNMTSAAAYHGLTTADSGGAVGYAIRTNITSGKINTGKESVADIIVESTTGLSDATWCIVQVDYSAVGAGATYLNGAANGTGTSDQTFTGTGMRIGATTIYFWLGYIAEVLVYNTVLSAGNRTAVTAHLGSKYAIAVS